MSNDYYNPTGSPTTGSAGSSSVQRTEFSNIALGFAKLPPLTGNGNRAVIINSAGTAMTVTTGTLALAGNFATTGAFAVTLAASAAVTLTLPAVSGTLATLAGNEALTNKTINGLTITPTTGTLSIAASATLTVSVSLTLTGTDATTMTFPATSATIARTDAGQTFAGTQTFAALTATSGTITTLATTTLTATTVNSMTFTGSGTVNFGSGGTVNYGGGTITLSGDVTGSGTTSITTSVAAIAGTAVSGTTGTGAVVFATTPSLTTPLLGTPTSGILTNCTGLPITTGVSGLGTGVATFLATPSSANLKTAVTDETGSGALVFANTPTLVTPDLGVATATSINKVAITAPATSATLAIADGKTVTHSATTTFAGTDGKTLTVTNSGTLAGGDAFILAIAAGKTVTVSNTLTLAGTDATTMTFPPASASIGYLNVPSNPQSADYTTVLADAGKSIDHPTTDANARTFTIDDTLAYPVGTCISFTNMTANVISIACSTAGNLYLGGTGTTGTRSLARYGQVTARKQAASIWIISGAGLT